MISRNEIASCSEKAYTSLPLSDAGTLLFFTNMEDILNFAKEVRLKPLSSCYCVCELRGACALNRGQPLTIRTFISDK